MPMPAIIYQHPPCTICGGDVPRKPGQRADHWRRRQTCSDKCWTAANSRAHEGARTKGLRYKQQPAPAPVKKRDYCGEYVTPAYSGLLGYNVEPPPHIAVLVTARVMRGALI